MYEYKVKEFINIYDGDTVTCIVDLGFGVTKEEKFRLSYINAPELKGDEREKGLQARDWLRDRIHESDFPVIVKTQKDQKGKYGRYLAELFINGVSLNNEMLEKGLVKKY